MNFSNSENFLEDPEDHAWTRWHDRSHACRSENPTGSKPPQEDHSEIELSERRNNEHHGDVQNTEVGRGEVERK